MNTSNNARRMLLAAILVSTIVLASCNDTLGIFASVAAEVDNSANKTAALELASPGFVVRLDTTLYAGIGRLWKKPDSATQWSPLAVDGVAASQPFAGSGVVMDVAGTDTLFVSFSNSVSGAGLGVWSTTDGAAWVHVDSAAFPPAGENLVRVLTANDTLFAVTTNERADTTVAAEYSIYYLNGASFDSAGIIGSTAIGVPTSVAFDAGGPAYIFTAGDVILTGAIGALAPVATEPGSGDSGYTGAFAYDTGVIIATRTGYLHYTADAGSSWTTAGPFDDSSGDAFSLSAPTVINDAILLVGTNSIPRSSSDIPSTDGYLEFDVSVGAGGFTAVLAPNATHSLVSSAVDFDSSLTTRSVSSMPFIDQGGGTFKLFACTDSYGLWSNTLTGATWGLWKRE